MRIVAYYLPQFHTFPENDKWWGEGFTEWENVRKAKPLYKGHLQPKLPLKKNYYNLLDINVIRWQCKLAKSYGVFGFCYYHYWFDGKLLLNRPMEILLENTDIDMPFCISWANENWTRAWALKNKEILIEQTYGEEREWREHFAYLLPFFKDKRYIKIDDHPIFIIYRPELIKPLKEMITCWQRLAKENGLNSIAFVYQQVTYNHLKDSGGELFSYGIEYQPGYVKKQQIKKGHAIIKKIINTLWSKFQLRSSAFSTMTYDYDDTWKRILNVTPRDLKMIPGAFVDWDNTPRYHEQATLMSGYTSAKFQKYLSQQIRRAKNIYRKDFIFLFAWNEWGEGGFLEPDEQEKYARLEALKNALTENGEMP